MPCDSITSVSIDLTKADTTALKTAMLELGFTTNSTELDNIKFVHTNGDIANWSRANGMIIKSSRNVEKVADNIKNKYTETIILLASKRMGWQVKRNSETSYVVTKR